MPQAHMHGHGKHDGTKERPFEKAATREANSVYLVRLKPVTSFAWEKGHKQQSYKLSLVNQHLTNARTHA
jgi:hypothetical protein